MVSKVIGSDQLADRNATSEIPKIEEMRKLITESDNFSAHKNSILKEINSEMVKAAKSGLNWFQVNMSTAVKTPVYEVALQELSDKGYVVQTLGPGDMDQESAQRMIAAGIPGKIVVMIPMIDRNRSDNSNSSGS